MTDTANENAEYTNKEIIEFYHGTSRYVQANNGRGMPIKFTYALVKNQKTLQSIVEDIDATLKATLTDEVNRIQGVWDGMRIKFAVMANDKPVVGMDQKIMIDPAKMQEYNDACQEVLDLEENAAAKAAIEARAEEVNKLLSDFCPGFKPHYITIEQFPTEISPSDFHTLRYMIKD